MGDFFGTSSAPSVLPMRSNLMGTASSGPSRHSRPPQQVTRDVSRVASRESRVASHESQVTSHVSRVTRYGMSNDLRDNSRPRPHMPFVHTRTHLRLHPHPRLCLRLRQHLYR